MYCGRYQLIEVLGEVVEELTQPDRAARTVAVGRGARLEIQP